MRVKLVDRQGRALGIAEVPSAWDLFAGDVLVDCDRRLVRVVDVVELPGSPAFALSALERAR